MTKICTAAWGTHLQSNRSGIQSVPVKPPRGQELYEHGFATHGIVPRLFRELLAETVHGLLDRKLSHF